MMSSVSDDQVMISLLLSCREESEEGRSTWEGKTKQNRDFSLSLSLREAVMKPQFCLPHTVAKSSD